MPNEIQSSNGKRYQLWNLTLSFEIGHLKLPLFEL
jgi:hypothetical protein